MAACLHRGGALLITVIWALILMWGGDSLVSDLIGLTAPERDPVEELLQSVPRPGQRTRPVE